MMILTTLALALAPVAAVQAAPAAHLPAAEAGEPGARPLAAGRMNEALALLERASLDKPHDAAVLINLGIAYAQIGEDAKARAAFEQAVACHEVIELDTADGTAIDSRRLARKALKMLARGEFRADAAKAGQLTYRD